MKKRWIVLIVAAAVAVVGMTVGTAMAAAPENAQHSRAAATRQTRQAAPREQTSTPEATQEPTATPAPNAQQPAAENNAAACPNHNENCPSDCTWRYGAGAAQTENDGCPYHGTDCPGDCMWYNGKSGCSSYDNSTGVCPEHDGYCRNGNYDAVNSTENGHHTEDHVENHDVSHDEEHNAAHNGNHNVGHEEDHNTGHNEGRHHGGNHH